MSELNAYDAYAYPSYSFPQTHPVRLATVARLFGLDPPPLDGARVLELGCASGGNLIPMAAGLPECSFVGLDYSQQQVAAAQETLSRLSLANIRILHQSILDVSAELGTFDYIIAHGVFSWVPTAVQEKILAVCRENLAPHGVAYVSYNTYPGWHMRGMIRDMMLYHAGKFEGPARQVKQARALLDFLVEAAPAANSAFGMLLRTEAEQLRKQADGYLIHEHLEEVNDPIYFHQFVERAAAHGLQYLGEAEVSVMWTGTLGTKAQAALKELESDVIQTEQYMDFLRNRMFRQTLLCHKARTIDRRLSPERLAGLYVASPSGPMLDEAAIRSDQRIEIRGPTGATVATSDPLLKAALACLREAWPQAIQIEDLVRDVVARLGAPPQAEPEAAARLGDHLLRSFMANLIDLAVRPPACVNRVSARPVATPIARHQATRGNLVTNARHETVPLNDLDRFVIERLDGRLSAEDLIGEIERAGTDGRINIDIKLEGGPATAEARRAALANAVRQSLAGLAQRALLVR